MTHFQDADFKYHDGLQGVSQGHSYSTSLNLMQGHDTTR
jgi:hypothetical protein